MIKLTSEGEVGRESLITVECLLINAEGMRKVVKKTLSKDGSNQ